MNHRKTEPRPGGSATTNLELEAFVVWLPPGRGSKSKIALDKLEEAKMDKSVSFEKDIVPIFRQFRDSMMWRLDLTSFDDLKANASMIYNQILWTPGDAGDAPKHAPSAVSAVDSGRNSIVQSVGWTETFRRS
jgi:hypothetical protein